MNNITKTIKEGEKIWQSIILDVDNVGVVIKQKDDRWFLVISGTKELVVDITVLFSLSNKALLESVIEMVEGKERGARKVGEDFASFQLRVDDMDFGYNEALQDILTSLRQSLSDIK